MYTKGEWKVAEHNDKRGFNIFADDGFVASVPMNVGLRHTMRECQANAQLISSAPALYEALKQIAKGEGRFSLDHLKHAENTIEDMKELATKALSKAEVKECQNQRSIT